MQHKNSAAASDSPFDGEQSSQPIALAKPIYQCAIDLVNDTQVLLYQQPPAVRYLSHWSREFRRRLPTPIVYLTYPEDILPMEPPPDSPDAATKHAVEHLIELVNYYAPLRPRAVQIVERFTAELIADQARHRIWEVSQRLSPKNVEKLDAVARRLESDQEEALRLAAE